jgi:hypothetical protein
MDTNQQDDRDERLAGDLLIGADAIRDYLIFLGMPADIDIYYLKRAGRWPIGNMAGDGGAGSSPLIASKRRLARHADIARGPTAA